MLKIMLIFIILLVNIHSALASDDIEMLKEEIQSTTDKTTSGLLYKKMGDYYVSQDDYQNAADAYVTALELARGVFSVEERMKIAVYLSWGGRLKEAIDELRLIISEEPSNVEARIHLARILSWSGRLNEAIEEADRVLKESPRDKGALLVKANALNWKGDSKDAIPIYERLLEEGEDFDARIGLTYAYLYSGNIKGARESSRLLKPEYPYQEREFKKLVDAMNRTTRPNSDIRYSFYRDSDDNRLNRYFFFYSLWLGNSKLDLNYRHTDARDKSRDNRAEDISLKTYSKVSESLGMGLGLGLNQVGNSKTTNFLTGNIKGDVNIYNGAIGAGISREVLNDTAQLIENRIRLTNTGLYISQNPGRLSLYGGYNYKDYSDENRSNDLQFISRYPLYAANPKIAMGYKFRYLDFNRQSRSGYFDPSDYISHHIFISSSFEKGKLYGYIEPFIGNQSFKRYDMKNSDLIGGAYGTFGLNLTKRLSMEANAEGGNSSVGTAAGFKYYLISLRLNAFL